MTLKSNGQRSNPISNHPAWVCVSIRLHISPVLWISAMNQVFVVFSWLCNVTDAMLFGVIYTTKSLYSGQLKSDTTAVNRLNKSENVFWWQICSFGVTLFRGELSHFYPKTRQKITANRLANSAWRIPDAVAAVDSIA